MCVTKEREKNKTWANFRQNRIKVTGVLTKATFNLYYSSICLKTKKKEENTKIKDDMGIIQVSKKKQRTATNL